MHDTAYEHGRLFFELYGSGTFRTVVELGSQDVNGSLRDHSPPGAHYIGIDMIPATGVDVVVDPGAALPLAADIADAVVTSSAFEHDVCFWDTFLELIRILRPGGLLYINAPSNGDFHRYPLDCWRFYPDAGIALVQWAARRNIRVELIESFIGLPQAERWADFVAVFRKAGGAPLTAKGRIADHAPAINIHHLDLPPDGPLGAETASMPDRTIAWILQEDLAAAQQDNATLSADLTAERRTTETLSTDLAAGSAELAIERQRNENLSAEVAANLHQAASLREQLAAAQQRIGDLEQASAELVIQRQRNESLSAEIAANLQQTDSLREQLATAQQRIGDLEQASTELVIERNRNENLSAEVAANLQQAASLRGQLGTAHQGIIDLEQALANVRLELLAMQNSTSWRLTAGLRRLMILVRGH